LPPAHNEVRVSKAASGELTVAIGAELPLSQAAEVQRRLKARETTAEMVLNPLVNRQRGLSHPDMFLKEKRMTKVLVIHSSPRGPVSDSRKLGEHIVERLRAGRRRDGSDGA
jgi:hypothetical protein